MYLVEARVQENPLISRFSSSRKRLLLEVDASEEEFLFLESLLRNPKEIEINEKILEKGNQR